MSYAVSITQDGTVLSTAGKYVDQDIVVGMSDSIKLPAQTFNPSASDQVIPSGKYLAGAQTVKACTGTKTITANGTHSVVGFANAAVDVPQGAVNCKRFEVSIASDKGSEWVTMIPADADLKAHRADDSLMVMWRRKNTPSGETSFIHSGRAVNGWFPGSSTANTIRQNATRINSSGTGAAVSITFDMYSEKTTIAQATVGCIYIDEDGNLQMQSNASYHIRSGDYEFVVSW